MDVLIIFLLILLVLSLIAYGFWFFVFWVFKQLRNQPHQDSRPDLHCQTCGARAPADSEFCPACGARTQTRIVDELLKDLAAAERQLKRFDRAGRLSPEIYSKLQEEISSERDRLNSRTKPQPETPTTSPGEPEHREAPASVVAGAVIIDDEKIVIEPVPTFYTNEEPAASDGFSQAQSKTPPRRSFAEVLNTFLEESNIRWGEIIGGLLIIGCSTALVVSLWSQIAQIPILKFLIFTTVTAALFGVGLYTEHRWKLPTTSRGILTTATLLVPLNFLAIAAVSSGAEQNALLIASEFIAPAIFLCLVYFAGRVLTPDWPHLLVVGVLGSSVGQLLVRHFASPDLEPSLVISLGLFPLACYVGSSLWMLKKSLADGEITEAESIAIYITLGALTFAAVLPFALLLYKGGPKWLTVIYIAPLISVAGFPMLATGMLLWRRATGKKLVATRTVGTSLALLGTAIVVSGLILAWPNPASIVPAALFNFAVFTVLAILLRLPSAHIPAAVCLALAYNVIFHVAAGHVPWQNLRVTSLLTETLSVGSGQALLPLFVLFVVTAEWLTRKRSRSEGDAYLIAACVTAVVSLAIAEIGLRVYTVLFASWVLYAVYASGAFWVAYRRQQLFLSWVGSALLLVVFAKAFSNAVPIPFPWQTAFLTHATVCALAAMAATRLNPEQWRVIIKPLNESSLISSFLAVICLVQSGPWQTTAMQAESLFWLSGIWLLLLWLNSKRELFVVFQVTLTLALVVGIKAALQQFAWYAYLPHAWLHPWGLQIQGTALLLLCLFWVGLRIVINRTSDASQQPAIFKDLRRLLGMRFSFDRLVLWVILGGFVLLAGYGALSGLISELTQSENGSAPWNIAGFPHVEALRLGSWIVLALLVIAMLSNLWERRRSFYLLGAVLALLTAIPLMAGTWEPQTATASAWRWLAVIALILFSLPLWFYESVAVRLKVVGWPATELTSTELIKRTRTLLLVIVLTPLLILTAFHLFTAVLYQPIHGPSSGLFAALDGRLSYGLPLLSVATVLIVYAVRGKLSGYAFAAGPFLNLTVTLVYLLSVVAAKGTMDRFVFVHVVELNVLTCALYGLLWLRPIHAVKAEGKKDLVDYFEIQVGITMALAASMVLFAWQAGVGHIDSPYSFALAWTALAATFALIFSCLWISPIKHALPGTYLAGLLAVALALLQSHLPPMRVTWATAIALAGYTVLASALWYSRATLLEWAKRLRIPERTDQGAAPPQWLIVFNTILSVIVVLLAFRIVLLFPSFSMRATAALAVVFSSVSYALIAEGAAAERLRRAAFLILAIGLVFLGWSVLVPGATGTWFNRAVILMVEMFVLTALSDLWLNRWRHDSAWAATLQASMPWVIGVAVFALLFSLTTEIHYQLAFGAVRISTLALIAIAVALAGAIALSLVFALSPKYDPLKLSERQRMNYVYAAEVMVGLLFMHIRLTLPWLFTGFFERYWPLVVMAIAYLGVATSETLRRKNLLVLSLPLERTGAFLPLLPVFGFWLARSDVDYSALLFIVGGLYGLLSILRRSFLFGLIAALAGNAGLWYLWHRSEDYHFIQHPQLWLVPIAASVLLAAYLNEDDFTEEQMAGIRYLSLITIYASSTADIFINGVADSPWLPLILAAFSLAGVVAGIIFKVRGFLMLGSVFLLLAIITMIWYASANLGWTWLWYVAGIVTGATIIFMFAVFEKKRSEVLRVVDGFKVWDR